MATSSMLNTLSSLFRRSSQSDESDDDSPKERRNSQSDESDDDSPKESPKMEGEVHSHLQESIRPYIDLIDMLRTIGIHMVLGLPTIVVIGDQSSGKSSVLEALSGVALPKGKGMVTRCPLELRLKKDGHRWKAVLSYRKKKFEFVEGPIKPGKLKSEKVPHLNYDHKKVEITDPSSVEQHVAEAQNDLAGRGVGISDELITLEVMSPDVCDLTLIDLPGIARVPVKGQPDDIGNQIKHLIMKFIRKQETIIMVVVPCNIDIATTEALKMAQEVDREGTRTLAILTKPDLIDKGTENDILDIVHNKVIPLHKGYNMVKCRGQNQINENIPLDEAAQMEKDFFANHDSFRHLLNDNKATIKCLAIKLTEDLVDHIKRLLPQLKDKIKQKIRLLKNELKKYEAGPPPDPEGAKQFLINILQRFNEQISSLSSGELIIGDNLFVQLRAEFKKWNDLLKQTKMSFNYSRELSLKNRGRELPGFSNYRTFEMLLQDNVTKLKEPSMKLLHNVKDIINKQFCDVVNQSFTKYSALKDFTMSRINNIQLKMEEQAEERIAEQFEMENMIYTQDPIYLRVLSEITNDKFTEENLPVFDKDCKYPQMLEAYYEIVVQRMADQLPLMILYFMLKQSTQLLSVDMLNLLDKPSVSELLYEDSDVSKKRKGLQASLNRLTEAEKKFSTFKTG